MATVEVESSEEGIRERKSESKRAQRNEKSLEAKKHSQLQPVQLSSVLLHLPNNSINPAFLCCEVSPVIVTGTVVVSMSAGRVGVAVSAGVVVSADTNTAQVKDGCMTQCSDVRLLQRGHINHPIVCLRDYSCGIFYCGSIREGGPGNTDVGGSDKQQRQK